MATAKDLKAVVIDWHMAGPEFAYIEWFQVPKEIRGQGVGRSAYLEWEKHLPKGVKYVILNAADSGAGYSGPFWDRLGFNYRWDFGYAPDPSDDLYEDAHAMIKGVRGTRTPKTKEIDPDES